MQKLQKKLKLLDCLIKLYRFNQAKNKINKALEILNCFTEIVFRLAIVEIKTGTD